MSREAAPPSDLQAPVVSERTRKPAPLDFTCEKELGVVRVSVPLVASLRGRQSRALARRGERHCKAYTVGLQ